MITGRIQVRLRLLNVMVPVVVVKDANDVPLNGRHHSLLVYYYFFNSLFLWIHKIKKSSFIKIHFFDWFPYYIIIILIE